MKHAVVWSLILVLGYAAPIPAQGAGHPLTLRTDIDTSTAVVRRILNTVYGYLSLDQPGWEHTNHWSQAEQITGHVYDPASTILGYSLPATVVQISPDVPDESTYIIKLLYAITDSARFRFQPIAVQRLYAIQEDTSWVLTSALARHTAHWPSTLVGGIRYHYAPQYPFRLERARSAMSFVDSLAIALQVPPPDSIEYYLFSSADDMMRALGYDWIKLPSGPKSNRGGRGSGQLVYSGDPAQGEGYRHELVHTVASALRSSEGRHQFIEEGFATWVGGTGGTKWSNGLATLEAFARAHSDYSWRELARNSGPEDVRYLTGALLFDAVYRSAGWPGVRDLLRAGRSSTSIFAALPSSLQLTAASFGDWWRSEINRLRTR